MWAHRYLEEGAGGSRAGNYKGRGSAGGPETRMKRYRGTQSGQQMAGGVRIWNELRKSAAPPYFKTKSPETQRRRGCRRLLVQGWATSPGFAAPHRTIANFRVVRASVPASLVRGLKERSGEAPSLSLWARLWVGRGNVARHQLCQSIKELLGRSVPPPRSLSHQCLPWLRAQKTRLSCCVPRV